mmetsp:Transcript_17422/g.50894  ORF Transcript_17422/g.50894 Transcript_17422/m.50894 type:complete len:88 (+) Transcript_17422:173-436(+)
MKVWGSSDTSLPAFRWATSAVVESAFFRFLFPTDEELGAGGPAPSQAAPGNTTGDPQAWHRTTTLFRVLRCRGLGTILALQVTPNTR